MDVCSGLSSEVLVYVFAFDGSDLNWRGDGSGSDPPPAIDRLQGGEHQVRLGGWISYAITIQWSQGLTNIAPNRT